MHAANVISCGFKSFEAKARHRARRADDAHPRVSAVYDLDAMDARVGLDTRSGGRVGVKPTARQSGREAHGT